MFIHSSLSKLLKYVDEESDHPFLRQPYTQLSLMYLNTGNYRGRLFVLEQLLKINQRLVGDFEWQLAEDHLNIGENHIQLDQIPQAIEHLLQAEMYAQSGLDSGELSKKERTECITMLSRVYNKFYILYAI